MDEAGKAWTNEDPSNIDEVVHGLKANPPTMQTRVELCTPIAGGIIRARLG